MDCRVCGRVSVAFNADGSINRDHDVCDAVIRDNNRPHRIPAGVGTRDWSNGEDARLRAEYQRRTTED